MAYEYNIKTSKNDIVSRNCLFSCHVFAGIVNLFVTTFLVAYIYKFNGNVYDYIYNVGIYNLAIYGAMLIFFVPIIYFVDKTNRVWFYRAGLLLRAGLVVLFIFYGEELSSILIVAGILNGFSEALYYSSYNVIKQEMVSRKNVKGYSALTYGLTKVVEVVCPIILGALIEASTFSQVAIVVLALCVVQVGTSFGIKAKRPKDSEFNLKQYFKKLNIHTDVKKKMTYMYIICAIYGASVLTTMLLNVCTMLQYGSNLSLGIVSSICAVISIATIFLVNKYSSAGKRSWLFVACLVLIIASVLGVMIDITRATIIIYNVGFAIVSIVYKYIFDVHRNGTLKEAGLYSEIAEHQTVVEVLANLSRVACFSILLLVALLESMLAFKIFLFVNCALLGLILVLLLMYERKFFEGTKANASKIEEKQFVKIMKILKES